MSLDYYVPGVYSHGQCARIVRSLPYVSNDDWQTLHYICSMVDDWEVQDKFSEPMVWIGIYIAVASLLCILAMATDLLHGFRNRKFWFPSKYFSLNAASITVITVTMKLPVDLSSQMPSYMDQAAKLGSLAFMCTMMTNLMPSLASMDNKTLLANIIGLSILVITLIVNIFIDINTGVISRSNLNFLSGYSSNFDCVMVAYIYMVVMLLLLVIMVSSSLTVPTSKKILEFKYQAANKTCLGDQNLQQMSIVEKLRQHVRRYWLMAETGNPQFVMASNPLSTASGLICVAVAVMNLLVVLDVPFGYHGERKVYGSAYKWSILFILITQSIGVVVATIAPIFRCFSVLSVKLIIKRDTNFLMVFEVEKYWTQKLYEWKQSPITFLSIRCRSRILIHYSRNNILGLWIRFQKTIVVLCKVISLIPIFVPVLYIYCWKSVDARLLTPPVTSRPDDMNEDLKNYVLRIHDEMEVGEGTINGLSKSMGYFIIKAEKEQKTDLLDLLERCTTGFKALKIFDTDYVQPLLSVEPVNSWSLSIVTLTSLAVALPSIHKNTVESLLRSVGEGLSCTYVVEETLNSSSEYVNSRKTSMNLWNEVEYKRKWLDNSLAKYAFSGKTITEILKWFAYKAKEIVIEIDKNISGEMVENTPQELIAANSMYRIAQTILLREESNTEQMNEEQLFSLLNGMIADILSACFTNLPRVIMMKCHESVIEKREKSVRAAAKLLGNTRKIIERLETYELPSMDDDKMAYLDEWRLYFKQSVP